MRSPPRHAEASGAQHDAGPPLDHRVDPAPRRCGLLRRQRRHGRREREPPRVGTFMWNNQEHLEAYLAIPSMGAVLHTLNIRLFPEQVTYIANHAEDEVVIVDSSLIPLLARVLPEMKTVRTVLVTGDGDAA